MKEVQFPELFVDSIHKCEALHIHEEHSTQRGFSNILRPFSKWLCSNTKFVTTKSTPRHDMTYKTLRGPTQATWNTYTQHNRENQEISYEIKILTF